MTLFVTLASTSACGGEPTRCEQAQSSFQQHQTAALAAPSAAASARADVERFRLPDPALSAFYAGQKARQKARVAAQEKVCIGPGDYAFQCPSSLQPEPFPPSSVQQPPAYDEAQRRAAAAAIAGPQEARLAVQVVLDNPTCFTPDEVAAAHLSQNR